MNNVEDVINNLERLLNIQSPYLMNGGRMLVDIQPRRRINFFRVFGILFKENFKLFLTSFILANLLKLFYEMYYSEDISIYNRKYTGYLINYLPAIPEFKSYPFLFSELNKNNGYIPKLSSGIYKIKTNYGFGNLIVANSGTEYNINIDNNKINKRLLKGKKQILINIEFVNKYNIETHPYDIILSNFIGKQFK
jgi:hypothetical protein